MSTSPDPAGPLCSDARLFAIGMRESESEDRRRSITPAATAATAATARAKPNDAAVAARCIRRISNCHLIGNSLAAWIGPDGHATFLQAAADSGWEEALDLGGGALEHIEGLELAGRAHAQYVRESARLCEIVSGMPAPLWDRVKYVVVLGGIAEPL